MITRLAITDVQDYDAALLVIYKSMTSSYNAYDNSYFWATIIVIGNVK
jgi:hypothetical protein